MVSVIMHTIVQRNISAISKSIVLSFLCGLVCVAQQLPSFAEGQQSTDILTFHYNDLRTGWNSEETALTPIALKSGSFGLLFKSDIFDEQIDAQPLILSNFPVKGERKNVVIVVTEYNSIYALDADNGSVIATRSIAPAVPSTEVCGNASDHLGINSTPVIDEARDTLYLVAAEWSGNSFDYALHAIDLATIGDPKVPFADKVSPVKVAASASLSDGSTYPFQANHARQRAALLLSGGHVYAGFSTFCDQNADVSRGWLLGWDALSLASLTPELTDRRPLSKVGSGRMGAIWMSGYGPAADNAGNIFVATGNSNLPLPNETFPPMTVGPPTYLSDSVVKLSSDLQVSDWFTPSDLAYGQRKMDQHDNDLGSGGVMLFPEDEATKSLPAKGAVAAGKTGQMYLMDRDSLGKLDPSGVNHVFDVQAIGPCFCGPSYFEGADGLPRVVSSGNNGLKVWRINSSGHSMVLAQDYAVSEPLGTTFFQGGFFTSVSSNDHTADSAIVWAIRRPQLNAPTQSLTLYAFDAKDGALLCAADAGPWPMDQRIGHGAAPNAVPVVANGKVFVASYKELRVFGTGSAAACSTTIAAAAPVSFAARVQADPAYPETGESGIVRGIIAEVTDAKMLLRTRDKTIEVDLSNVLANGRYGNLDPGKPVTIKGTASAAGSFLADSIYSGN